jgi:hypothetical protein
MSVQWKVTYRIAQSIEVTNPVTSYTDLAVSLRYDSNAKLTHVEHQLVTPNTATRDDVLALSQEQLQLFWEVLHYQRGVPLTISGRTTEQMQKIIGSPPQLTSDVSYTAAASLCRILDMPSPNLFASPNSRLIVWLRLANEATSATPVDAIRNYYMIWEDMYGKPTPTTTPPAAYELKFIRDFLSHGEPLNNSALLAFIQRELGVPANQYNPTDRAHQTLVRKHHEQAKHLIDGEISKHL